MRKLLRFPSDGHWIIATGPLTSGALADSIRAETGAEALAFFDAIAPIVYAETVDMSVAWMQSRYDKGETAEEQTAYMNCPMDRAQYEAFVDALLAADKTEFREGETAGYFRRLPAHRGDGRAWRETLRFGPMKPVGLTNPHRPDVKPYAVVQLRRDNKLGTLYNIVGFQTKMKYGAQTDVFRMIPGLEQASFARLGGIHRNTFLNSPTLLDAQMRLRSRPHIRFAGQVTGVEGYVESAAMGLLAGRMAAAEILDAGWRRHRPRRPWARWSPISRGRRGEDLPTDERELRAVSAHRRAGRAARAQGPLQGLYRPGEGGIHAMGWLCDALCPVADGAAASGPCLFRADRLGPGAGGAWNIPPADRGHRRCALPPGLGTGHRG